MIYGGTHRRKALKTLKNDKERIAFLEDYRNTRNGWRLWKCDEDLSRTWWRLELPDGSAFVVEEQLRTITWPKAHMEWLVAHWYILPADQDKPFGDYCASRTMALNELKRIGRAAREA